MTDRQTPDDRSRLARLFGALGNAIGRETNFALNDIRQNHERLWFGEAQTPTSDFSPSHQRERFEDLYGQTDTHESSTLERGLSNDPQSTQPADVQQVRFEELYGRSSEQPYDALQTPDRTPEIER